MSRETTIPQPDGIAQETIELLRAEVEQLQFELAERDAQLAESIADSTADINSAAEEHLLARMDQLLAELDRSDERTGALEELLQAAEEAVQAEREERRQLESWVGDIETGLGQRHDNWTLEKQAWERRLDQVTAERDRLLEQLSHAQQPVEPDATATALQLHEQLESRLAEEQEKRAELTAEVRRLQARVAEAAEAEGTLREERLELARERAGLARLRAELAAERALPIERQGNERSEIDGRVRAFREHLREIHDEEQQEQDSHALSSRISRLWKRIETHLT